MTVQAPEGAAPTLILPGSYGIPATAPVYVDGIPAASVTPGPSGLPDTQRFWSSQPRLAGDPAMDQVTVTLAKPRLLNYLSFDLPHFPHQLSIFAWSGTSWAPVQNAQGAPFTVVTAGSVPGVINNPAALSAGMNPYHYGAGHWVHYDEMIVPVTTTQLMFQLTRALPGSANAGPYPVGPAGAAEPYPLGLRNLDFGYRIRGASDIPQTPRSPSSATQRQPFTTSTDVQGSPTQIAIRENRATDLLRGSTWRSGPQPISGAVVCLYIDSRDADGNPQLTDRFYLDPVTSGVRFNLYYSPEPPPPGTVFRATDDPLLPPLLTAGGAQLPVAGPAGITFPAVPGWLTLGNQAATAAAGEPWWAAIEIMPRFGSGDPGSFLVADCGVMQLSYSGGSWNVTMPGGLPPAVPGQASGGTLASWAIRFSAGDRLQFVFGFDGASVFAWLPSGGLARQPATAPQPAAVFRFGATQDISASHAPWPGNYILTAFILKQQKANFSGGVPGDFTLFTLDPAGYVSPPLPTEDTTLNAVARFLPAFVLGTTSPWGFCGGLGSAYQACSWIPVQRSFTLARGLCEFDPVRAAAWKFEFTSLQPEPFEYYQAMPQQVQVFPAASHPTAERANPGTPATLDTGLAVAQGLAATVLFADTPAPPTEPPAGQPLPTEALYATDPIAAGQMAQAGGSLYNFQHWQPPAAIPQTPAGTAAYPSADLQPGSRVAYFVALSALVLYRVQYQAADDTEKYVETFGDTANIDPASLQPPGAWQWQPGLISVPSNAGPVTLESATLASAHQVTAVQFATVQSPPTQILDDPGFEDSTLQAWQATGDALPLTIAPTTAQFGNMVQVTRGPGALQLDTAQPPYSWAYLEATFSSWQQLMSQVPAWEDFQQDISVPAEAIGGMQYAGTFRPSSGAGRLYIAARVFSPVALAAPLFLQLTDGATGVVIAEAEAQVAGGTVTEFFAGFTIGSKEISVTLLDWAQVQAAYPTWASINGQPWNTVDLSVTTTLLGATVGARLIQKVSTTDTWSVDDISVFDDPIVWEFSNDGGASWWPAYDMRNDPDGALLFPPPAQGAGNQLRWRVSGYAPGARVASLAIRPWYITWPRGITPRPAGIGHGPNMSPLDHYPPVRDDPWWQMPSSPVPQDWFFAVRQALLARPPALPPVTSAPPAVPPSILGDALVYQPAAPEPPEPQTFTDIFTDIFTDTYAPADGGEIFTDTYSDVYGEDYLILTGTVRAAIAHFAAIPVMSTAGATIVPVKPGVGADFGPVSASSPLVTAWGTRTGLPLPARRIALGNQIPATLAASPAAGDAGTRRVVFDVRPDATTTPAQLSAFLASCQDGGLQGSVSLWAGMDACFMNPADYQEIVAQYIAAIRQNGYGHAFAISNTAIVRDNALPAWWPGASLVDLFTPIFYCQPGAPGSGGDTLAIAINFAAASGIPFGLIAGIDTSQVTAAQASAYLSYLQNVFPAAAGTDVIFTATGTFSPAAMGTSELALLHDLAAALPGS